MKLMEITGTVEVHFDEPIDGVQLNEDDGPLMKGYIRFRHGDMNLGRGGRLDPRLPDDEMLRWRVCSGQLQAMDRENGKEFPPPADLKVLKKG